MPLNPFGAAFLTAGFKWTVPSPATHAILTQLKAGETVNQVDKLPKTL